MTVRTLRADKAKLGVASGGLLGVAALVTTAFFTDFADLHAQVDGSENTFDIVVSGSLEPGWEPAPSEWVQADDEPFLIDLGDSSELPPGATKHVRVAVKNASPRVHGGLTLELRDPDPLGDAVDPVTGRYLELFDKLEFELSENGATFFTAAGAGTAAERTYTWPETLAPGDVHVIDVAISLPGEVDDRWQQASTQLQFGFEAVSGSEK